jgi:hypothetical protein
MLGVVRVEIGMVHWYGCISNGRGLAYHILVYGYVAPGKIVVIDVT